jgi:hypothetical protein
VHELQRHIGVLEEGPKTALLCVQILANLTSSPPPPSQGNGLRPESSWKSHTPCCDLAV